MTIYIPKYVPDDDFNRLWDTLDWERRDGAPRREYWQNDFDVPYTYGSGIGIRTYDAKPWDSFINDCRHKINDEFGFKLNCCFVNGYNDHKDSLGWHADDSPEMSMEQPVAVISLGAERNIMLRNNETKAIETVRLDSGSLLIMPAGFQLTHQHKIPKGDRPMGPRVSLTYRGLLV